MIGPVNSPLTSHSTFAEEEVFGDQGAARARRQDGQRLTEYSTPTPKCEAIPTALGHRRFLLAPRLRLP